MAATLDSLVDQQAALVREASLALPGEFTQCTYDLGHIKQAVYLCLTCQVPRGICSACSIACHGDHEQIELFPKRYFRCDCPTHSIAHTCTLKSPPQPDNSDNKYGQNFERGGLFCRCASTYDAKRERETMVQCLACEDWFHESCLGLRDRVPPRPETDPSIPPQNVPQNQNEPIPQNNPLPPVDPLPRPEPQNEPPPDDASSAYSDDDLPAALLPGDSYETLICGACVRGNPTVRRYAGTPGVRMLALAKGEGGGRGGAYMVIGEGVEEKVDVGGNEVKVEGGEVKGNGDEVKAEGDEVKAEGDVKEEPGEGAGTKRRASEDVEPPNKRPRASPDPSASTSENKPKAEPPESASRCIAPPVNPVAQAILDGLVASGSGLEGPKLYGDVFLSSGWRERWCRCATCDPPLLANPYLLEEEETYEPPKDPDAGMSLEELGMRALATLPHERALDSIRAYNSLRDDLMLYLRPFADSGREVREEDITAFFDRRRQRQSNESRAGAPT